MRALEAAAIEAGTPERVLQERAGLAVADMIEEELAARGEGARRRPRIVVLVGSGNNGRDGAVAGRRLAARGCEVQIWHGSRNPLSASEIRDFTAEGIGFPRFAPDVADSLGVTLFHALRGADIVIDGMLGVGARGPMRPDLVPAADAVRSARVSSDRLRVVAVDVPSGIDANTGAVPGRVVSADITVTFGGVKAGLLRFPAASHVGRLVAKPIGLPNSATCELGTWVLD